MAAEPRADDAAKRSARAVISIGAVRANAARKAADAGQRLYCADQLLALCEQRGDQAEAVRGPAGASLISSILAETEGFEPSVGVNPPRRFSKPLVSATHPRLRITAKWRYSRAGVRDQPCITRALGAKSTRLVAPMPRRSLSGQAPRRYAPSLNFRGRR